MHVCQRIYSKPLTDNEKICQNAIISRLA